MKVTGVFAGVVMVLSGQSGRPSGAQSGLPSKASRAGSWASSISIGLVLSWRTITSLPVLNVPFT